MSERREKTAGKSRIPKDLSAFEIVSILFGVLIAVVVFLISTPYAAFSSALGSLFSSLNLRLSIWVWRGILPKQSEDGEENQPQSEDLPQISPLKFSIKYTLLSVILISLIAFKLVYPIPFAIGLSNIVLATAVIPIFSKFTAEKKDRE